MQESFTRVPNVFFDTTADLTNAEFRVLFMVVRKLIGWNKKEDKISCRQLVKLTGLSFEGVRNSMNHLVEKGILNRSQYQLGKGYIYSISESDQLSSILLSKSLVTNSVSHIPQKVTNSVSTQKKEEKEKRKSVKKHTDSRVKPLTDYFFELYQKKMKNGQKPAWGGKEGQLLKRDIQRVGDVEKMRIAIQRFFGDKIKEVKEFVDEKTGYTYGAFHGLLDRILNEARKIEEKKDKCPECGATKPYHAESCSIFQKEQEKRKSE